MSYVNEWHSTPIECLAVTTTTKITVEPLNNERIGTANYFHYFGGFLY